MLKTTDGKEIDPREIDYIIRGGITAVEKLTGVVMKDGTEQWLQHTTDEVMDAINNLLVS